MLTSHGKEIVMAALEAYVPVVQTEADSLARFLNTLSTDDWQRPSACDLWTIRDVVAHLIWAADFYTDTVSRGMQGDISRPEGRPPGDAPNAASMPAYFDQHAIRVRDRLGAEIMPMFRSSYRTLSTLMLGLSARQWDMPCSFFQHYGGTQPAHAFLFLIIQELAIHGWDIRSRFDGTVPLSAESLPPLMERIPKRLGRAGLVQFPIDADRWPLVRYRFDLRADSALRYDLMVEAGKARMESSENALADVTLRCNRATFALMMYKRLSLAPAVSQGRLTVEGDQALTVALDCWLRQP
jgi:uncharacterized protein (TIGR03083 family)